jgi:hypothetical protein
MRVVVVAPAAQMVGLGLVLQLTDVVQAGGVMLMVVAAALILVVAVVVLQKAVVLDRAVAA